MRGSHWHSLVPRAADASSLVILGRVDKFEPVSGDGEMDHSKEAVGQLVATARLILRWPNMRSMRLRCL